MESNSTLIDWQEEEETTFTLRKYIDLEKLFTTRIGARLLNHWEKEGVIEDNRLEGKGWRKYTATEQVWINIIAQLRQFNFPLEKIEKLKQCMEINDNSMEWIIMPVLNDAIIDSLVNLKPVFLIVKLDGSGYVTSYDETGINEFNLDNHISINLNKVIKYTFPWADAEIQFDNDRALTKAEQELLISIRTGCKQFLIKTREGKIKEIEAEEVLKDKKSFREIASEYPYQDIKYSIKDNVTRSVRRTVKNKY